MTQLLEIPVEKIRPNPEQPRLEFDSVEIASLAESIRENGLIQPITVEERGGEYVLIDGERRLRAVKLLKLGVIQAVVNGANGKKSDKFTKAVVANLQRSDLNPIEEGKAFLKWRAKGLTVNQMARMVGRSNGHVNMRIKLVDFEPEIQNLFAERKLPIDPTLVYSLFKLPDDLRVKLALRYAAQGTTVSRINQSITRILNAMDQPHDVDISQGERSPAEVMSGEEERTPHLLKLLEKDGALPQWDLIQRAAKGTCEHCNLSDMASAQTCKECPAVELLKRLNKIISEEKQ